ncbi:glycoside hydrolase family 76 protein [Xylaria intraflava]|nr:glycoside hydrolase family 76 protein [Xylaria intraflava]
MAGVSTFVPRIAHFLSIGTVFTWAATASALPDRCPIYYQTPRKCDPLAPASFLPPSIRMASESRPGFVADRSLFADLLSALNVTQSEYFAPWLGTWPDAIDWTAAVIGTHVSAATRSISEDLIYLDPKVAHAIDWRRASNLIDGYFAQIIAYYFGQDALMIRNEAYDDILWVVLGWLETNKFINAHNNLHYTPARSGALEALPDIADVGLSSHKRPAHEHYYGDKWVPAFSHRARVFWELASHGWDSKLCNGGMIWNPRLLPYKNAITNELYIAASISMYLYFPGDDNQSPFSTHGERPNPGDRRPAGSRDAKYLKAAVDGYRWLRNANMTNSRGLFVDGFHISGYLDQNSNNTHCDQRDEMVFSYNQGVILTGLRGLWDATGAPSFLSEGHALIQNVIDATGFNLAANRPKESPTDLEAGVLPGWHGLGRLGVLEEACDASGTCSQDGQTFKGIFFHHLSAFCAGLEPPGDGLRFDARAFAAVRASHVQACRSYGGWLAHNVGAALGTRDATGRFGQWWTAGLLTANWTGAWPTRANDGVLSAPNATDYRNYGVPNDTTWRPAVEPRVEYADRKQFPLGPREVPMYKTGRDAIEDPNSRGRGRTVETQSGGLGLLRAYWEIARVS